MILNIIYIVFRNKVPNQTVQLTPSLSLRRPIHAIPKYGKEAVMPIKAEHPKSVYNLLLLLELSPLPNPPNLKWLLFVLVLERLGIFGLTWRLNSLAMWGGIFEAPPVIFAYYVPWHGECKLIQFGKRDRNCNSFYCREKQWNAFQINDNPDRRIKVVTTFHFQHLYYVRLHTRHDVVEMRDERWMNDGAGCWFVVLLLLVYFLLYTYHE